MSQDQRLDRGFAQGKAGTLPVEVWSPHSVNLSPPQSRMHQKQRVGSLRAEQNQEEAQVVGVAGLQRVEAVPSVYLHEHLKAVGDYGIRLLEAVHPRHLCSLSLSLCFQTQTRTRYLYDVHLAYPDWTFARHAPLPDGLGDPAE
jgi:hypothetical protein